MILKFLEQGYNETLSHGPAVELSPAVCFGYQRSWASFDPVGGNLSRILRLVAEKDSHYK